MAIALVSQTAASGLNGATTSAIDTTGASLLVVLLAFYDLSSPTLTDSKGNTWTALTATAGANVMERLYYVQNPTVGTGHTFTVSGVAIYASICVAAFSGAATASVFDAESAGDAQSPTTTIQPGSVTPAADESLVIVGLANTDTGTVSINGGFTITDQMPLVNAANFGGALAYLVQTTAAAANPTWTLSASVAGATRSAVFNVAAAPSGNPWNYYQQQ